MFPEIQKRARVQHIYAWITGLHLVGATVITYAVAGVLREIFDSLIQPGWGSSVLFWINSPITTIAGFMLVGWFAAEMIESSPRKRAKALNTIAAVNLAWYAAIALLSYLLFTSDSLAMIKF